MFVVARRAVSPVVFIITVIAALCGCSGNANSTSATATDSPSPAATATPSAAAPAVKFKLAAGLSRDKRTGLPTYPGSIDFGSHMDDADWKLSTFTTNDNPQKVAAWYKHALPSSFAYSSTANDWKLTLLKSTGGPAYDVDIQPYGPSGSEIALDHHP